MHTRTGLGATALLAVALVVGCVDTRVPEGTEVIITCTPGGDDCPADFACAQTDGAPRCVSLAADACGNGRLDEGEACDDQNLLSGDGCSPTCQLEGCGNATIDPGEACDDGNLTSGDGCRADCAKIEVCGDGALDEGEACDDGNASDADACLSSCVENVCGDGVLNPAAEACDDGNDVDEDACLSSCELNICGDGLLNAIAEECDDGNDTDADGCLSTCRTNVCGDGARNPATEACDDGNDSDADACLSSCEPNVCGDGILNPFGEACDDGNDIDEDACLRSCDLNTCGDGIHNPLDEACDDGNAIDEDSCLTSCELNTCGDGFLDLASEACDDGNESDEDRCLTTCEVNVCGDGIHNPVDEDCDDGNESDLDGCLITCVRNVCGDGLLNPADEACDDGNAEAGDACLPGCVANVCGDGIVNPLAEACDDGNIVDEDGCLSSCAVNVCGDGVLNTGVEVCDDGNTASFDGCRADCGKIEVCGDGVIDGDPDLALGEHCDDANSNPYDACDSCRRVVWSTPSLSNGDVNALGPGGGIPTETANIGGVHGLAVAPDGAVLFIGDDQVFRIAPTGERTRVAGDGAEGGYAGEGGLATAATLQDPQGLAVDAFGRILIADAAANRVLRIDTDGIITTVAGGGSVPGDGQPATSVSLSGPRDVAVDNQGGVIIAETQARQIRRVGLDGVIETIAGTGAFGDGGDGGPAIDAVFNYPGAVVIDAQGLVTIADGSNTRRIRQIDANGDIDTIAGNGGSQVSGDGGPPLAAAIGSATQLDVDPLTGDLLIGSYSHLWRLDVSTDTIHIVAGNGSYPPTLQEGVPAVDSAIEVSAVAVGVDGIPLFGEDWTGRIRQIDSNGNVTTVAGTQALSTGVSATSAFLFCVSDAVSDGRGGIVIADFCRDQVFRREADGTFTLVAGNGSNGYEGDGLPAVETPLAFPFGLAVDSAGVIYISDSNNNRVRTVDPVTGLIDTIVGTGAGPYNGDDQPGWATNVSIPSALRFDADGNLYIADSGNNRVRRMDTTGYVNTVAGDGTGGFAGDNDLATNASLNSPYGLALDSAGRIYIGDSNNNRVRRVDIDGIITTVAGNGVLASAGDFGAPLDASLNFPVGVAVDALGRVFIAENSPGRVRMVEGGVIQPFAGYGSAGLGDGGLAVDSALVSAIHLAIDDDGSLLITDADRASVRRVDAGGTITTIAGLLQPNTGDLTYAELAGPTQIARVHDALFVGSAAGLVARVHWPDRQSSFVLGYPDGYAVGADPIAIANRARFTAALDNAAGLAWDGGDTIYVSDRGAGRVLRLVLVDQADPSSYLVEEAYDGFVAPSGLWFEAGDLYIADAGDHVVYVEDTVDGGRARVYGSPGAPGLVTGRLWGPSAVTTGADGAVFIADTNNHRVLRVTSPTEATVVLGTGEPASSGDGAPAAAFPVEAPAGVAVDEVGNLLVTGATSVRLVTADETGAVDGSGRVATIYGGATAARDQWPMDTTRCLSGVSVRAPGVVDVVDSCVGYLLTLRQGTE